MVTQQGGNINLVVQGTSATLCHKLVFLYSNIQPRTGTMLQSFTVHGLVVNPSTLSKSLSSMFPSSTSTELRSLTIFVDGTPGSPKNAHRHYRLSLPDFILLVSEIACIEGPRLGLGSLSEVAVQGSLRYLASLASLLPRLAKLARNQAQKGLVTTRTF